MTKTILAGALMAAAGCICSVLPQQARAQTSVTLDCSGGSDFCTASVNSPNVPLPLQYAWRFDTSTKVVMFPANCTNKRVCSFTCPNFSGTFVVNLTVSGANNQFVGSASTPALCTPQPE